MGEQQMQDDALPKDHYAAHVTYAPFPSKSQLETEFEDKLPGIFDRKFYRHDSCKNMDETPGERIFWLAEVPAELIRSVEETLAWGDAQRTDIAPNGYRPATAAEAYELSKAQPELQREFAMIAYGSWISCDGESECFLVLSSHEGGTKRNLGIWRTFYWSVAGDPSPKFKFRFLFVPVR